LKRTRSRLGSDETSLTGNGLNTDLAWNHLESYPEVNPEIKATSKILM
jgi:hypothetical protein